MSLWGVFLLAPLPVLASPDFSSLLAALQTHYIITAVFLGFIAIIAAIIVHLYLRGSERSETKEEEIYISPRTLKIPRNCWFSGEKKEEIPSEATPLGIRKEGSTVKMRGWVERSIVKETFLSKLLAGANPSL